MQRKYDIILFGATGFTGQLVAQYLAANAGSEGVSWGIAGRDLTKLQQIQLTLKGTLPSLVVADVNDLTSLENMAASTRILMSTVGPFNLYGYPVVDACIREGTHYMDLSGEPAFVNRIYADFDSKAVSSGVSIVNCCGFDSIPADYAAWLTALKLPRDEPKALFGFVRTNASFSGGTWASAINGLFISSKKTVRPAWRKKHPSAPKIKLSIHYNGDIKAWVIPMPVSDPHIVKRSAARLPSDYGEAFSYGQFFVRSSFYKVVKMIAPLAMLVMLAKISFFKNILMRRVQPGTGPSAEVRSKSKFEVICIGKTPSTTARTRFAGGDPGYDETAKIFSEAAFCLLNHIDNRTSKRGVLTPVEAFGTPLLERLKKAGLEIE